MPIPAPASADRPPPPWRGAFAQVRLLLGPERARRLPGPWRSGLFGAYAVIAVVAMALLMPPFENSDEFNHFNRADQIASGQLVATRYGGPATSGGVVDLGIDAIDSIIGVVRFHADRKVTGAMLARAGAIGWTGHAAGRSVLGRGPVTFANTAIYMPALYLPAVAAIWIGEAGGFSIVHTLQLARLFTGLASTAIAALAIGIAGEAGWLLLGVCCLPMTLSLFASVSQDGPMIALAMLAAALASRGATLPDSARTGAVVVLTACLALVVGARPAYAPLALLPVLLDWVGRRRALWSLLATLLVVGGWSLVTALFTMIDSDWGRGVNPSRQAQALLHHPLRLGLLAWHAVTDHQGMEGLPFWKEFLGVPGWIDVRLPDAAYDLLLVFLAASVLSARPVRAPLRASRRVGVLGLMLVAVVLVFAFEYLTFTTVGFPFVEGVQGRYFLPIAAFAALALPGRAAARAGALADAARMLVLAIPALTIPLTIVAVVKRYYLIP